MVAFSDWRKRRFPRANSLAFAATILVHALAVLVATYVSVVADERRRPAASAALTLIDLSPDSGAAIDENPAIPAAPVAPTLAAAAVADAPPAPIAIATTPIVGRPAGSPGSGGFDPYAGAAPVLPLAAAYHAGAAGTPQALEPSSQGAPALDAGLAELRDRIARPARGAHGSIALQVLIDGAGAVRDVRVVGGDLALALPGGALPTQLQGLRLFPPPPGALAAPAWRALPDIQL